jgi:hypothetical protein
VRLGGEVKHGRRAVFLEDCAQHLRVADVDLGELIARSTRDIGQRCRIRRIREQIHIHDWSGPTHERMNERRADEPCAAGDEIHGCLAGERTRRGTRWVRDAMFV